MTFHVFEGFLSLFLCLFIKGIFISEQSDIRLNLRLNYARILVRNFQYVLRAILVYFIRKVEIVTILD